MLNYGKFWMTLLAMFAVVALALPAAAVQTSSGEPSEQQTDDGGCEPSEASTESEIVVEAFNLEKVTVNGYGTWGYGRTDENHYLTGTEAGDFSHTILSLGVNAQPHEQLAIVLQVKFANGDEGEEVHADYAFGEWAFTDGFKMRIGQVKLPFGLYTEIFHVGTLRPFLTLPQGIYGGTGIVSEAFRGGSVTGAWYGSDWGFEYDGYGGQLALEVFDAHFSVFGAAEHGDEEVEAEHGGGLEEEEGAHAGEILNNLVGGRFNVVRPMSGLKFGVSAYSGKAELAEAQHVAWAASGEYLTGPWSLRSELGRHQEGDELHVNSFYFEGAYKITPTVQAAFRYDWSDTELHELDTSSAPSLLTHRDYGIGLNYWFQPEFVVKFGYHIVDGNRFAIPDDIEAHGLVEKTNLFTFGASFSF